MNTKNATTHQGCTTRTLATFAGGGLGAAGAAHALHGHGDDLVVVDVKDPLRFPEPAGGLCRRGFRLILAIGPFCDRLVAIGSAIACDQR